MEGDDMTWPRSPGTQLNFEHKPPNSNIRSMHYDSPHFLGKGNGSCLLVSLSMCLYVCHDLRLGIYKLATS